MKLLGTVTNTAQEEGKPCTLHSPVYLIESTLLHVP